MKWNCICFLCMSMLYSCSNAQVSIDCTNKENVRKELRQRIQNDQHVREELIATFKGNGKVGLNANTLSIIKKFKGIVRSNQEYVNTLLDKCGWPNYLDSTENNAIFLIIDHSKVAYMEKYFPLVENAVQNGYIEKGDLSTLKDRILLKKGEKQIYGTQTIRKKDGTILIWPIENLNNLDSLRNQVGLPSMNDYIKVLEKTMNARVDFNKSLTIEEAKEFSSKNSQMLK